MADEKLARIKLDQYRERLVQVEEFKPLTLKEFKNNKLAYLDASALNWLPIYDNLLNYFAGSETKLDLNKGILLAGGTGTGKTQMMKMFAINPHSPFKVVACRDVSKQFMADGADSLIAYRYLTKNLHRNKPIHGNGEWFGVCFDDLGTESSAKNFGNSVNVMAEIIQDRYDLRNHKYTHVTTNLSADQIREIYGDRIYSRMAEMFNIVNLSGATDMRLK